MKISLHPSQPRSPTGYRSHSVQLLRKLFPLVLALALTAGFFPHPLWSKDVNGTAIGNQSMRFATPTACYGVYHIVKPGQTLYSIAALYGTTAYRIALCNRLSAYTVYVGQSLLVPIHRPTRSG